jgi:hypothetical protein
MPEETKLVCCNTPMTHMHGFDRCQQCGKQIDFDEPPPLLNPMTPGSRWRTMNPMTPGPNPTSEHRGVVANRNQETI